MADIIRTFNSVKVFKGVLGSVHLVENSPFMRDLQRQRLCQDQMEGKVHWYDRIEQVPRAEGEWTMIIAHEFFDALPVHVFQNTEMGFREVLVDLDDRASVAPAALKPLRLVLSPGPTLASQTLITDAHQAIPVGAKLELSPSSTQVASQMARLLKSGSSAEPGGAGLVVDYGGDQHFGYSLRGFYQHQIVDPLSKPGLTDITANVDFGSLKRAMNPHVSTYGPITQRDFLLSMGIEVRTSQLNKSLVAASERLVSPIGMGEQYKFLAFESAYGESPEEVYPFPTQSSCSSETKISSQ